MEQPSTQKVSYNYQTSRGSHLTRQTGCPVAHIKHSLTAGPHGPLAVQDAFLLEKIQHFDREKIPPRNVHAVGTGAYGIFRSTGDGSRFSRAKVFEQGKQTPIFVRLSGVFTELGEAQTVRDIRGYAIKFYTEEGNWDLLGINTPVFNCRDMKVGPDAIHAFKRDPRTGDWNPTQTWDFVLNHPESLHQTLMMYTDVGGTPTSFRYMDAYGCHTFSMLNQNNERIWVKFHILSTLGSAGLDARQAKLIAGEDPNFLSRDLREAIETGKHPKWKFCIQVMKEEEGYRHPWAFDATKVWPQKEYPLIELGEIVLNRNPVDHFAEVEQVAFSPLNLVPGIGFSPDKLLQGRLLVYDDTQYHRLGPNYKQLYINRPQQAEVNTTYVGGSGQQEIINKFPHYLPSMFGGPKPDESLKDPPMRCDGPVDFYDLEGEGTDLDYYGQAAEFYRGLQSREATHLVENIALSWEKIPEELVTQLLRHFHKIDGQLGQQLQERYNDFKKGTKMKTEAEILTEELKKALLGSQSL
jgi:catalase